MAADLPLILGRNLRAHRRALGLSQEAFALEVLHVHRTYGGVLERGERNVTLETLAWIAERLGVEAHVLLIAPDEDRPAGS